MTVSITTPQEVPETAEILRFLHRFAELMSRGSNSENLLRAARLLEAQMDQVKESNELLRVERVRSDTNLELRMALEGRAAGLESEMTALKSQLSETELRLSEVALEAEQKQGELLRRAEEAEAQLAAAFEKSGNIVSQVMCEASASNLDRVIVDAGASEAENRSNHAA